MGHDRRCEYCARDIGDSPACLATAERGAGPSASSARDTTPAAVGRRSVVPISGPLSCPGLGAVCGTLSEDE